MREFEKWDVEFRKQNLYVFNGNEKALLWLKVRAVCRAKLLGDFLSQNKLTLKSKKVSEKNEELFCLLEKNKCAMKMLDTFLSNESNEWYQKMGVNETTLKEDLYKVRSYEWGGDQNNSLDKFLVRHYVKEICSYETLVGKKDEIAINAWNYVQTSWYNNWTSYLIESLFKKHHKVISAVGEIKSVDFFINEIPVDLKVTFFPNQYMAEKVKEKLGKSELIWLKSKAREYGISFDEGMTDSQLKYALIEKFKERKLNDPIDMLRNVHRNIVLESQKNPKSLIQWLYENQGEMRFGAENRLFLVLVDLFDIDLSWKMKRNFTRIEPVVQNYLKKVSKNSFKEINFFFKKQSYKCLSDILFVLND